MADSNIKELYEFLKSYDLIQADISEEEAQSFIDAIYSSLEPDENLLTGFISSTTYNNKTEPKAFFVTNKSRLLYNPLEESLNESYSLEDIDYIDEGEDNTLILKFNDNDEEIIINTKDKEGVDLVSDALYSSFAESLDEDQLTQIFGEEIDEDEEEVDESEEDETIEDEIVEDDTIIDQSTQEVEIIESDDLVAPNSETAIAEVEKDLIVPETDMVKPESEVVTFTTETDNFLENAPDVAKGGTALPGAQAEEKEKKGFHLTKPMIYTIAGIGILALILLAYFLFTTISTNRRNSELANELVDILNQDDEVYFACVDYQTNNFNGATPDKFEELSKKAEDIYNKISEMEPTDGVEELFQNIYFYTDALQSTTYFGKTFTSTQNQLNRMSFDSMLDAAYRYRLTILGISSKSGY